MRQQFGPARPVATSKRRSARGAGTTAMAVLVAGAALPLSTPRTATLHAQAVRPTVQPAVQGQALPTTSTNANVDRRLRFSLLGALSGAALAGGYYVVSERGDRAGRCQPWNCALPYLSLGGAISGLFMARELDALKRAETPRTGIRYTWPVREATLLAPPIAFDVRDSLIAVVSDSGAQIVSAVAAPRALRRRATGLTDLRQVAITAGGASGTARLLVGSGTSLWETDLVTGPASRAIAGPVDALAASPDATLSASGQRLFLRTGTGDAARLDSLDVGAEVRSLAWDATGRRWWVATDSLLAEVTTTVGESGSGALALSRRVALPAPARGIATSGEWIAVALGDEGIAAWRRESLGAGVVTTARLSGEPRFAYDVAFVDEDLYVAGGVDGVYRVSLSPVVTVLGSSRQFPFATMVRAGGGGLWVGDRGRGAVIRVEVR